MPKLKLAGPVIRSNALAGKAEPEKKLHGFLKLVKKKLKHIPVNIYRPDRLLSRVTTWIKTGIPELDQALGGGIPVGRFVEVFGSESVGKSAFAQLLMTNLHAAYPKSEVLLVDAETSLDDKRIQSYRPRGLDTDRIFYATPVTCEEMFDLISVYLDYRIGIIEHPEHPKNLEPAIIVWDSIASTPPQASRKRETMEKVTVGAQARALSDGLQAVNNRFARARVTLLAVNQDRTKIGAYAPMGVVPSDSPGGKAPKFYTTIRLRLKNTEPIPVTGKPRLGTFVRIRIVKNKLADPGQDVEVVLDYSCGISPEFTLFHRLLRRKKLRPQGQGKYRFAWDKKGAAFLRSDFPRMLAADPTLREKCVEKAQQASEEDVEGDEGM